MNFKEFQALHGEDFRQTLLDVDRRELASLLDDEDFTAIGELVWRAMDAAKEAIENEQENPEASPDHYLDDPRRGQAREFNSLATRFYRFQE